MVYLKLNCWNEWHSDNNLRFITKQYLTALTDVIQEGTMKYMMNPMAGQKDDPSEAPESGDKTDADPKKK